MEDFFAIPGSLFLAGRPFLALLTVWVFLIDYINSSLTTDDFVPFRRVGFNGCTNFHDFLLF